VETDNSQEKESLLSKIDLGEDRFYGKKKAPYG
jgi:hypothetical protein